MIYKNSRYSDTTTYLSGGKIQIFDRRKRLDFSNAKGKKHEWRKSIDTTDNLAYKYYASSALWWVILDANPEYPLELDIPDGAEILIPDISEVLNTYVR